MGRLLGVRRTFLELKVTRDHGVEHTEFDEGGLYEFFYGQRGFPRDRVKPAADRMKESYATHL